MKENNIYTLGYAVAMRDLFGLLMQREKDVVEVSKLFSVMNACIDARRDFQRSETPESEALARWRMDTTDTSLSSLMRAWCLLEGERDIIRSLVRNSV